MINTVGADWRALFQQGFVMPIIIQASSAPLRRMMSEIPKSPLLVMALLDTGATTTTISDKVAEALELIPLGFSKIYTAAGLAESADYAVDISFPNGALTGFANLKVGSCNLPYNENLPEEQRMEVTNFGALIGRDMMSRWNIVWNGPTSSVFISD